MTLVELLAAVRAPYSRQLSEAASAVDSYIEPAFRNEHGELVVDGSMELPSRADYIARTGDGRSSMVDASAIARFEPVVFRFGRSEVAIFPFTWDWATVEVNGLSQAEVVVTAKAWFMRWFDPDDKNAANGDGLFGVTHFLGEPEEVPNGVKLTIDLGSAPAQALAELLDQLSEQGASRISVA